MRIKLKLAFCIAVVAALAACGGGGGGGATSQTTNQAVASTDTFQLRTANAAVSQQTSTLAFSISGNYNSVAISGSGTLSRSAVTSTTFEGVTALAQTSTTSGTFSADGTTYSLSTSDISYSDSNYLPLGTSGSEYEVVNGIANIPNTVLVNDSGTVYTASRYTNSTKSTSAGSVTVTYSVVADTAHTALLKFTYVYRDASATVTNTDVSTFRITPSGGITYISSVSSFTNGNQINLVFQ